MAEKIQQIKEMWESVSLPVLCFGGADGGSALFFQNGAALGLCARGGSILDEMPAPEARELLVRAADFCNKEEPLFCHIGEKVYSAVFFPWESCCVCILHDVSAYYRDIQSRLDEALMASRAKSSFLSEMSHDIRTPMNAIIGMTDIALMQKETPPRIREYLEKIKTASGHMMSIINEVLDMSRIESGRIVLQPEELDIADLLHEILVVARPQADEKELRFVFEIGRMDCGRMIMDGVRFKQICLNLLSNAIKFTPAGGTVTLFLEIRREGGENEAVLELYVRDTGIGMSREFLTRVFTPFEREQSLTISKIEGTGLGMSIAKNLVELMGGRISVESEPGKGSCFTIVVPLRTVESDLEGYRRALEGQRLLLMDSLQDEAELVISMAEQIGMSVDRARNPEEAVGFLNDAIFTDVEYFAFLTAEKTGDVELMSFLPEVRMRMGGEFPILLLLEGDWKQTEYMFTRAGVDEFVPLPLFRDRLFRALYAFSDQGRSARQADVAAAQSDFSGRRILLAEDNELNREIACEILGMTGAEVETAEDGGQALEKFKNSPPFHFDLIFMDIQMPVMNGLDTARALRGLDRPDAGEVPIVAMTANAFVEDVKNSLDAGMNAHVSKPLDMDVIFSCLENFLGRRGK